MNDLTPDDIKHLKGIFNNTQVQYDPEMLKTLNKDVNNVETVDLVSPIKLAFFIMRQDPAITRIEAINFGRAFVSNKEALRELLK